jgi:hypothetical protein
MSSPDATRPQDLGPERLKPAPGAPILDASVEAEGRATDLCTDRAPLDVTRERILTWLAEGAREVTWALCWLPRERWADLPPLGLGDWPALRHVGHLVQHETHQILPAVRQALGGPANHASCLPALQFEQADATGDSAHVAEAAEGLVRGLGEARFELLQRLEAAPEDAWQRPLSLSAAEACGVTPAVNLGWFLLSARQHEQQHMAAIWKIALNWDRVAAEQGPLNKLPLHPADRLEESH